MSRMRKTYRISASNNRHITSKHFLIGVLPYVPSAYSQCRSIPRRALAPIRWSVGLVELNSFPDIFDPDLQRPITLGSSISLVYGY